MYDINNKDAAIREVQTYLHFVRDAFYPEINNVSIDGIYGAETQDAVLHFQKENGLDESGIVDYDSFIKLRAAYEEALFLKKTEGFVVDKDYFPLKKGDQGAHILTLNIMLSELGNAYDNIPYVKINDYYSSSTENAVRSFREIFLFEDVGFVDEKLYDRIIYEINIK